MSDQKKPSIFEKMLDATTAYLDSHIYKARSSLEKSEPSYNFGKAVTRDRSQFIGSQGWQEKPGAIGFEYQRHMALKSSIISAIIKTRQSQVGGYTQPCLEGNAPGFKVSLKNEKIFFEKLKNEMFPPKEDITAEPQESQNNQSKESSLSSDIQGMRKAEGGELDESILQEFTQAGDSVEPELSDSEKDRRVRDEIEKRTAKKKHGITQFIINCGELKERPFETKKWNFDSLIRSLVWDTLVYDQIAVEIVPKEAMKLGGRVNIHHFYPVDGSTIRFASPELKKYKNTDMGITNDILFPEYEIKALNEKDALELDEDRLEQDAYKFVQVIRGRIQRAFTEDELVIGFRNPLADIYTNGYSISELELLIGLVTSHLQTEYYNKAYFQQGFSAKGILHIKANLNREKLEEFRRHWSHMVKGNRNSFQTPIMSGMDEVQWIPLTQNHNEMEFSLWLNYLIKMICSIYQIDPSEIGYGIRDEGNRGSGGLSGDNTKEKLATSKDKGFKPLMKFLQDFINKNIISKLDDDYVLEWTGLDVEDPLQKVQIQAQEVKYKKTVNEIRAEEGLPPIDGCDHLILDPVFFQWFSMFSEDAKQKQQNQQIQQIGSSQMDQSKQAEDSEMQHQRQLELNDQQHQQNLEANNVDYQNKLQLTKVKKSETPIIIEYYTLKK